MIKDTLDVVIVGGGIMGCATAYNLLRLEPALRIAVIEKDPTYAQASSTLSLANIRIQFSLAANIAISQYGLKMLETFEADMAVEDFRPYIAFRREGNLFLTDADGEADAHQNWRLQSDMGCEVDWLSTAEVSQRYPLMTADRYAAATFSSGDGHFDAYAVLMAYRKKAIALGARFVASEVGALKCAAKSIRGVVLTSGEGISAPRVVNCAGAWAADLARSAGVDLPVEPVKRQVFVADPAIELKDPLPLTVLPSGLFFRTDTGGVLLIGKSLANDPVGFDFSWQTERFTEHLWPELADFVPAFDTLKLVRGWAGLYAVNTLDSNAILGEWPELQGFYLANGFSGHGLQQAPAVGRYLAELILGLTPTLDLSIFNPQRILDRQPLSEHGLV